MSITFAAALAATDIDAFRLTCEVYGDLGEYVGYTNAYGEADAHRLLCTDTLCQQYGPDVEPVVAEGLDPVNLADSDAAELLALLGLPDITEGEISAALMLDRVDAALIVGFDDEARPEGLAFGILGLMTTVERRAGYLTEKLTAVRVLARACADAGRPVVWH